MSNPSEPRDRVQPEVLGPIGGLGPTGGPDTPPIGTDGAAGPGGDDDSEQVTQPTKLIRIASMVRSMLDEVRRAQHLAGVVAHDRGVGETGADRVHGDAVGLDGERERADEADHGVLRERVHRIEGEGHDPGE